MGKYTLNIIIIAKSVIQKINYSSNKSRAQNSKNNLNKKCMIKDKIGKDQIIGYGNYLNFYSSFNSFFNSAHLYPIFQSNQYFMRTLLITRGLFGFASMFPQFAPISGQLKQKIRVIHTSEIQKLIPEGQRQEFKKQKRTQTTENSIKTITISEKGVSKLKIGKSSQVSFSEGIMNQKNFVGIATKLLSNAYIFNRKQKSPDQIKIECNQFKEKDYILELVNAHLRAKQWANMRGDEADPKFFLEKAQEIASANNLKITTIKGDQLVKEGFRLMHAVGRASQKQPIFINLTYHGNPESNQWISFVGKGVCFDSGGLNLKSTASIKNMHMDKHGAASVLSAIQAVSKLKMKVNLTVSMGFVQNFVSSNSYRPLDIIKSRKGITVEIGNTDAQGRLVLADCMNWTQQKFKVKKMIQLSTLTGAIVVALGHKHAGLFSNSDKLSIELIRAGQQVQEQCWRMPVDDYHSDLIKGKHADITNSAGKSEAGSSQAAAFLQNFVEKEVEWVHLDIAGTSMGESEATGYGSKLLVHYLKNCV